MLFGSRFPTLDEDDTLYKLLDKLNNFGKSFNESRTNNRLDGGKANSPRSENRTFDGGGAGGSIEEDAYGQNAAAYALEAAEYAQQANASSLVASNMEGLASHSADIAVQAKNDILYIQHITNGIDGGSASAVYQANQVMDGGHA